MKYLMCCFLFLTLQAQAIAIDLSDFVISEDLNRKDSLKVAKQSNGSVPTRTPELLERMLDAHYNLLKLNASKDENYWSLLQISKLNQELQKRPEEIIHSYKLAYSIQPKYHEPLLHLALYQRQIQDIDGVYKTSVYGLTAKQNKNFENDHSWTGENGLLLGYAFSTYWKGLYLESLLASNLMSSDPYTPSFFKEPIASNLKKATDKVADLSKMITSEKRNIGDNEGDDPYHKLFHWSAQDVDSYFGLSKEKRRTRRYNEAYNAIVKALVLRIAESPSRWQNDYQLLLEYSLCTFKTKRFLETELALKTILNNQSIPDNIRNLAINNLTTVQKKLRQSAEKNFDDFVKTSSVRAVVNLSEYELDEEEFDDDISQDNAPSFEEEIRLPTPSYLSTKEEVAEYSIFPQEEVEEYPGSTEKDSVPTEDEVEEDFVPTKEIVEEDPDHLLRTATALTNQYDDDQVVQRESVNASDNVTSSSDSFMGIDNYSPTHDSISRYSPSEPKHDYPGYIAESAGDSCRSCGRLDGIVYSTSYFGKGLGRVDSYQTLGTFYGSTTTFGQTFLDLRAHNFENNKWGANAGLGFRVTQECTGNTYGINGFYDYRSSYLTYHQVGAGLEFLGCKFDLFINGYYPIGSRKHEKDSELYTYPGEYFARSSRVTRALYGGDFELGTSSCRWFCNPILNFYFGAGGYYYPRVNNYSRTICGLRYRADINFKNILYFGILGTSDAVNDNNIQGYIGLSLPFDECGFRFFDRCECHSNCLIDLIQNRPVTRNPIIFESKPSCHWETNY